MAGVGVGLLLGAGVFCVWWSFWPGRGSSVRWGRRISALLDDQIAQAGVMNVSARGLLATCGVFGLVVTSTVALLTAVPAIAVCFGAMAAWAPLSLVRFRAR